MYQVLFLYRGPFEEIIFVAFVSHSLECGLRAHESKGHYLKLEHIFSTCERDFIFIYSIHLHLFVSSEQIYSRQNLATIDLLNNFFSLE